MFLIPPKDIDILKSYFSGRQAHHWPWPLSIISDDRLLKHIHTDYYPFPSKEDYVSRIVETRAR